MPLAVPPAAGLLADTDERVRIAAFEAIAAGDTFALEPALAALADARMAGPAGAALDRLGDAVVAAVGERLAGAGVPADLAVLRLVRALHDRSPARDEMLRGHVGHPDRDLGLLIVERLVGPAPAAAETGTVLDRALDDDTAHAARILTAVQAIGGGSEGDGAGPLARALRDELDLVRARVTANRLARHGTHAIGPALVALGAGGRERLSRRRRSACCSARTRPAASSRSSRPTLPDADRLRRLVGGEGAPADLDATLRDLVEDRAAVWRSPWLRACAIHAAIARGRLAGNGPRHHEGAAGSGDRRAPRHGVTPQTGYRASMDARAIDPAGPPGPPPTRDMAWIPGGTFRMGSDDFYPEERPVHEVAVDGFWMDDHPVTVAEFRRFVKATGYVTARRAAARRGRVPRRRPGAAGARLARVPAHRGPGRPRRLPRTGGSWVPGAQWRHPEGPGSTLDGRERHPVTHVAYEDADGLRRVGRQGAADRGRVGVRGARRPRRRDLRLGRRVRAQGPA